MHISLSGHDGMFMLILMTKVKLAGKYRMSQNRLLCPKTPGHRCYSMLSTVMVFHANSDAAHLISSPHELGEMCILKKDTRRRRVHDQIRGKKKKRKKKGEKKKSLSV